jgi:UDP-N-acetylglucosamine 2-epimerase
MMALVKQADVVLTDSGGLQKECFWLKTPCGTLRDTTEWMEIVKVGANRLLGANPHNIEMFVTSTKDFRYHDSDIDKSFTISDASKRILDDISGGNYKI